MSIKITREDNKDSLEVEIKMHLGVDTTKTSHRSKLNFLNTEDEAEDTELIPPGFIYIDSLHRNVIFQVPPELKEIEYHRYPRNIDVPEFEDELEEEIEKLTFDVWIPWSIYMGNFDVSGNITDTFMFFSKQQIQRHMGVLSTNPLPNFFKDYRVCRSYTDIAPAHTLSEMINTTYNTVWDSHFNRDTFEGFMQACKRRNFLKDFGLKRSHDFTSQIERWTANESYDELVVEDKMIEFLKAYSLKSKKFILEAVDWPRSLWGDSPMPGIGHLIHYIETNNRAFDETALNHVIWQKSLENSI